MFKHPENLIIFLMVFAWVALTWRVASASLKAKREKFASLEMMKRVANHKPTRRPVFKWAMLVMAILLIAVGLMRPTGGITEEDVVGKGLDLVVALDVSKSMMAMDIDGNSRLEVAKALLARLMGGLTNDRIGLVVFAGETMVQSPLSRDRNAFLTFLERVDPALLSKQGTNLSGAIETSIDRFDFTASQSRAIVLLSDGEDKDEEKLNAALDEAKSKNIPVFTVGIGSLKGANIPEARNVWGDIIYKRHKGQLVKTKLEDGVLRNIAKKTGGKFFRATDISSARQVAEGLSGLKRVAIISGKRQVTRELYFIPGLLAFFLLLLEWMISERIPYEREKDHWLKRI